MSSPLSELNKIYRRGYAQVKALQAVEDDTIKCLERGCSFETEGSLTKHIMFKHKLTRTQYIVKHQLPYQTKLYGARYGRFLRTDSNIIRHHNKRKRGSK